MPTNQEITDSLLSHLKRRPGIFGKWLPLAYWINKMDMEKLDNGKVKRALEWTGSYMTNIADTTHGFLCIEITQKRLRNPIGIKWFICCSSKDNPDLHTLGNYDKSLFGKMLQANWDRYTSVAVKEEEEKEELDVLAPSDSTAATGSPSQPTPSSSQTEVDATPTTRIVTPSAGSPQLRDEHDDLQEFFRSILNPEYLTKNDLFLDEVTVGHGTLKSKLVAFVKKQEVKTHVERYKLFYSDVDTYKSKDIMKLEPDPCLTGKYGIPMNVPAMSEVAQALLNLSSKVPEVLQLPKHSGSKGHGKRLVAVLPSFDKNRLYQNVKGWMCDIIKASVMDDNDSDTSTDASMKTYDVVEVLIKVLLTIDPIAFEDVAAAMSEKESYRSKHKLDPELQQPMMFASGIKQSQMRVVKKYLCYANLDILQPESEIKKLQVNQYIKPTSIPFKDGGNRTKVAWAVPVDTVLMFKVNQNLAADAINFDNLSHAHVILVGDHGQGAFRMMTTLLLIRRPHRRRIGSFVNDFIGTVKSAEVDALVGYVLCTVSKRHLHSARRDDCSADR